jgi:hypothetical protein
MNQKTIVIALAAMFALMATIALVPQAFAQDVTNGGIDEDDDTTNQHKQHPYQSQRRS